MLGAPSAPTSSLDAHVENASFQLDFIDRQDLRRGFLIPLDLTPATTLEAGSARYAGLGLSPAHLSPQPLAICGQRWILGSLVVPRPAVSLGTHRDLRLSSPLETGRVADGIGSAPRPRLLELGGGLGELDP